MKSSRYRSAALILPVFWVVSLSGCFLATSRGTASSTDSSSVSVDADSSKSPPADPAYYDVPSVKLGAVISSLSGTETVTFKYWNPQATAVSVAFYASWDSSLSSPSQTVSMTKASDSAEAGIWCYGPVAVSSLPPYYDYYVTASCGSGYVLDPYAASMAEWKYHSSAVSISGDSLGKGAIVDPSSISPDNGWDSSHAYFDGSVQSYAYSSAKDAVIYEAGIRDMTVDPSLSGFASGHQWGTFKALIDMLPHIKTLGVTHIQLLCPLENYYYDQSQNGTRETSTSETSGANYNWGYDPQNYFTPSGMYSANPLSPTSRINELMTLVNEVHKAGMGVILDVVFNHTANDSILGSSVNNGYYYRTTSNNGAGSHDVASEAKMMRKLIVDSIVQWVKIYHVDGFRFDLMGDLDTGTIKACYNAAHDINPKTIFVGEGWTGFYSGSTTDYLGNTIGGADQSNSRQFSGMNIGLFSDSYRNIFKNGYPSDGQPAFITGTAESASNLFSNISGIPTNTNTVFSPGSTSNVISYLTCHDNLCLYDDIAVADDYSAGTTNDALILQRAKLAFAAMMTSQGIAFVHAGDEMFRTKATTAGTGSSNTTSSSGGRTFVSNSYNASDAINMISWSNVYNGSPLPNFTNYATSQDGYQLYQYVAGLISLRKSSNAFRLPDGDASGITSLTPTSGTTKSYAVQISAPDGSGTYCVFMNASTSAMTFSTSESFASALLLVDGTAAGTTALQSSTTVSVSGSSVTLQALSCAVFKL